jgi:large subunit ribosomal protein L20
MVRVKRGTNTRQKHNKLWARAKGMIQTRRHSIKRAHEAVTRRLSNKYIGRKLKKRDLRRLWIVRINAACRQNNTTYSRFIKLLNSSDMNLDRKILADIAFDNPTVFAEIIKTLESKTQVTV